MYARNLKLNSGEPLTVEKKSRRGLYGHQFQSSAALLALNERVSEGAATVLRSAFKGDAFTVFSKYYLQRGGSV
jgi:hypothetical protein